MQQRPGVAATSPLSRRRPSSSRRSASSSELEPEGLPSTRSGPTSRRAPTSSNGGTPPPPKPSVARRYVEIGLDSTDASVVALAARLGTARIASFDERHFRVARPLSGRPAFMLVPADAPAA
jgi:hypothetical protein